MPHTLRSIDTDDETVAELTVLTGFDEDLAAESTWIRNRIRGLLTQIYPSLERVLGRRLDHPGVLALLEAFPTPVMMAATGRDALLEVVKPHAPRITERLVINVLTALKQQPVVVAGMSTAATILPHLTGSCDRYSDSATLNRPGVSGTSGHPGVTQGRASPFQCQSQDRLTQ